MNQIADFGVAAHWKHKDPKKLKKKMQKNIYGFMISLIQ